MVFITSKTVTFRHKTANLTTRFTTSKGTLDSLSEGNSFRFSVSCREYAINSSFTCDSFGVDYVLGCKVCGKQYVGSTFTPFRVRFNNYKSSNRTFSRGISVIQAELFKSINHPPGPMQICIYQYLFLILCTNYVDELPLPLLLTNRSLLQSVLILTFFIQSLFQIAKAFQFQISL